MTPVDEPSIILLKQRVTASGCLNQMGSARSVLASVLAFVLTTGLTTDFSQNLLNPISLDLGCQFSLQRNFSLQSSS
jgi:hypothetical protein